jgi:hypothetical protein
MAVVSLCGGDEPQGTAALRLFRGSPRRSRVVNHDTNPRAFGFFYSPFIVLGSWFVGRPTTDHRPPTADY